MIEQESPGLRYVLLFRDVSVLVSVRASSVPSMSCIPRHFQRQTSETRLQDEPSTTPPRPLTPRLAVPSSSSSSRGRGRGRRSDDLLRLSLPGAPIVLRRRGAAAQRRVARGGGARGSRLDAAHDAADSVVAKHDELGLSPASN